MLGKLKSKLKFLVLLICFIILFLVLQAKAQIASYFVVQSDTKIQGGEIVSKTSSSSLILSSSSYDPNIFGVVALENPIMLFNRPKENSFPIITYGEALVKVSNKNGKIKPGDFITSSEIPGVGQKALTSGMVLGKALEALDKEGGIIKVFVNPQYANIEEGKYQKVSLSTIFKQVAQEMSKPENIPQTLRYFIGAFLGLLSFLLGFFYIGRTIKKGVEGISRNPLARRAIFLAMLWNLVGIVIITLVGLALSIFVILY